ncbi:hypothetical protein NPIL_407991 [Nephila pilipes]|uniref:Uncharacterized protein n=1 Tax=Nephila pilipes TaxID=299642 RepID=A0A8X6TXN5_NEPPI|nr:hypothetical protein NPIL_407991 [Nephila pilipes]
MPFCTPVSFLPSENSPDEIVHPNPKAYGGIRTKRLCIRCHSFCSDSRDDVRSVSDQNISPWANSFNCIQKMFLNESTMFSSSGELRTSAIFSSIEALDVF